MLLVLRSTFILTEITGDIRISSFESSKSSIITASTLTDTSNNFTSLGSKLTLESTKVTAKYFSRSCF